jgi:superfamily II DNA helicase RecQ
MRCRARFILEYFGEEVSPDWRCHHCDACDAMDHWKERDVGARCNGDAAVTAHGT